MAKKILAMSAHPDDMELEAGGMLAKFANKGYEVHSLVLTSGEYEDTNGKFYSYDQLYTEARNASKILGIKDVTFLDYKATTLSLESEIVKRVDKIINDTKPDILISHHPFDSHQDHKVAAEIMFAVSRKGRVKNIFSGSPLPYRPNIFAFRPQFFVDITETIDMKLDAIRAYKSQYDKFGGEQLLERIRAMAKTHGWAMGYEYAECFEVVRIDDSIFNGDYL